MAIPSGSYRVSMKSTRPQPFPAPPPKSKRREINTIIKNTAGNITQERVFTFDSLTTVDANQNLIKIYFTPAKFINGKLQPSNIKENYLYVNGVYVKKNKYIIYEEDTSLVVEVVSNIGYRILPDWDIRLRIRANI